MEKKNISNEELVAQGNITKLLVQNKGYICMLVNQLNQPEHKEDLIQVANIGMYKAMLQYDPSRGANFLNYSTYHIKREMIDFLADNSRTIRLPRTYYKRIKSGDFIEDKVVNGDQPISETDNRTLLDLVADEPEIITDYTPLLEALNILSIRQREIIKLYYGFPPHQFKRNAEQIGVIYGVSKQRIHQILLDAKNKLSQIKSLKSILE